MGSLAAPVLVPHLFTPAIPILGALLFYPEGSGIRVYRNVSGISIKLHGNTPHNNVPLNVDISLPNNTGVPRRAQCAGFLNGHIPGQRAGLFMLSMTKDNGN